MAELRVQRFLTRYLEFDRAAEAAAGVDCVKGRGAVFGEGVRRAVEAVEMHLGLLVMVEVARVGVVGGEVVWDFQRGVGGSGDGAGGGGGGRHGEEDGEARSWVGFSEELAGERQH